MNPINIVDVIDHRNEYATQRMLVVNRFPKPLFTKDSRGLIGVDDCVHQFYKYERPGPGWEAFAGREFDIPMADGTVEHAKGQWWDVSRKEFRDTTYDLGMATIEQLKECYVFYGGKHIDRAIVDVWLAENTPSNNYNKYDERHATFRQHQIVSPWETEHAGSAF